MRALSPCEALAIEHAAQGMTSKESAQVLGKSYRTVEVHRFNATKKLNARNMPHAVALHLKGTSHA